MPLGRVLFILSSLVCVRQSLALLLCCESSKTGHTEVVHMYSGHLMHIGNTANAF